jgi:hypothetical protein
MVAMVCRVPERERRKRSHCIADWLVQRWALEAMWVMERLMMKA